MTADTRLSSLYRSWRGRLLASGIDNPSLDLDLICSETLGVSRSWLHCHGDSSLFPGDISDIELKVSRRETREPLHYILGSCPFWGRPFSVRRGCLIPRPETEFLLEAALECFSGGLALDWGTGSGCLAGSLLKEVQRSYAVAVDSSPLAIDIAHENLSRLRVLDRCLLWHCHDPNAIPVSSGSVDLVLSNPPYIPSDDVPSLMEDVSGFEPVMALDGGKDGLDPYRVLLPWAEKALKPGGRIWVEFGGESQVEPLREMTPEGLSVIEMRRDLSGIPRLMGWCRV
ncbi:MAG: peptide chain release factor N(5)-glutamine methyltransferase [Synergistales bacterium]|nr:peptide chain release factor N(5)-glutamine methyltransferase [Synergistales bacterium]